MKKIITLFMLILLCAAFAQPLSAQGRQEKGEIKRDMKNLAQDQNDLDRLSDLIMHWNRLTKRNANPKLIQAVENQIRIELRHDLNESHAKVRQAQTEVKRSVAELTQSDREFRWARWDRDRHHRAQRDDKRDRRDDARDLKGDRKDLKQAEKILQEKRTIGKKLMAIQKRIDNAGKAKANVLQNQKQKLLMDYLELSQKEIQLGYRELIEDRHERRKDRLEFREDARHR